MRVLAPPSANLARVLAVRWSMLAAGAILLLAGVLRLYRLAAQSLWLDEGSTWSLIQSDWGTLFADLFSPAAAYPLYHLLLKAWVAVAGDSEWALRLPSAVAGVLAVLAIWLAAQRIAADQQPPPAQPWYRLAATLLLGTAPVAIWYAQEAKVYSMLLLASTLLLWALLRAVQQPTRGALLLLIGLAVGSLFLHRLALLLLLAMGWAWLWAAPPRARRVRLLLTGGLLAGSAAVVLAMARGLGSDISETGAYIPATPPLALKLTLLRFTLDRGPAEFPFWWLLPWIVLGSAGTVRLLRDVLRPLPRSRAARVLLCFLVVPPLLFLSQLAATRLFEARYLLPIYPAWLLLLAYPLLHPVRPVRRLAGGTLLLALLVNGLVLTQPAQGIFSGDPVKEQYREAVQILAERVHPDDLIVLHPAYIRPLYDYYMARHSRDPAPVPVTFEAFKHRQREFNVRDWDAARQQAFAGHYRSFLLIAPNHARTVDKPLLATDEYGLVGLYYQFSREQQKWPCGIWRTNGAHLFCQDSPEAYETGDLPPIETPYPAQFGDDILLLGYTLKATTPQGVGVYRAGGNLPVTLFWDVLRQPSADYSIFLHLCQQCDAPPPASSDAPPYQGYLPTSVWLPNNLIHDEQAIPLPADLPPGTYRLYVGLYRPGDPATTARLPITSPHPTDTRRLLLGEVQILAEDG